MSMAVSVTAKAVGDKRTESISYNHLPSAFRAEEIAGLKLATYARLVAVAIIAVWLVLDTPVPALYYFEAVGAAARPQRTDHRVDLGRIRRAARRRIKQRYSATAAIEPRPSAGPRCFSISSRPRVSCASSASISVSMRSR